MKQTSDELNQKLIKNLIGFTEEIGIHIPPHKIESTTTSLINLFHSYERYRSSIISNTKKEIEQNIGKLPSEDKLKLERILNGKCNRR